MIVIYFTINLNYFENYELNDLDFTVVRISQNFINVYIYIHFLTFHKCMQQYLLKNRKVNEYEYLVFYCGNELENSKT